MGKKLDWDQYIKCAREAVAEGAVLVENKNQVLPLAEGTRVSVFGRIQAHYFKSGTGSGGMVNVAKVIGIVEGLKNSGKVVVNEELEKIYAEWIEQNPYQAGNGWGEDAWSQEEMPLTDEIVKNAADKSEVAIVIIGRTAGEDRDASATPGSMLLTDIEEDMLAKVRAGFKKVVVVLNVANIIDMNFVEKYSPDAVLYAWQGGMIGGDGTADVLVGNVSPSGKLTDTIPIDFKSNPADRNFGSDTEDLYEEDIYVGYRYYETFNKGQVYYPFGYGLSYTTFEVSALEGFLSETEIELPVKVKNTGNKPGKEVIQVYLEAPQGKLGKPLRSLVAFAKTKELRASEEQVLPFILQIANFASFDDSGVTGYPHSFVLEPGEYKLYVGTDVRNATFVAGFNNEETVLVEKLSNALHPVKKFNRIKPVINADGEVTEASEEVPYEEPTENTRRAENLPREVEYIGKGKQDGSDQMDFEPEFTLKDVLDEKATMYQFIGQFTDDDLSCIVRGEGMGSALVTPGTASAFGGVSPHLRKMGIPAVCCDDGPSGMRLDSGAKAFSLPIGTMLACTFNTELVEKLYSYTGLEMVPNNVEVLLGPGMNIHRHPLNGRNFEYFSEDPLVTGMMASAMVKGLQSAGVTGCIKHFCGNNQEHKRHFIDSVISERALREIYLRGFEIVIRSGLGDAVMTTYGSVNGLWTAGSYELTTTILRDEWGFKGVVMTDWWAGINERGQTKTTLNNFAQMVRAQNDMYMCCPDGASNASGDNTLEALSKGEITRAELQRIARNVCSFAMKTQAMKRLLKVNEPVEVINRPSYSDDVDMTNLEFVQIGLNHEIDLSEAATTANTNHIFPLILEKPGLYRISLTGSSELSRLAQIPVTIFSVGSPMGSYTFNGSDGKDVTIDREFEIFSPFVTLRIYVGGEGLQLKKLQLTYLKEGHFIDRSEEKEN